MDFWVGVTDNDWFKHLSSINPKEVAFWHPSGQGFGAVLPGAPFLFKLKRPNNHIAGGGFFSVSAKNIPLRMAWDTFREKIGASTFEAFSNQIAAARGEPAGRSYNPAIGFSVISQPYFFPREQWIEAPDNWKAGIQKGKVYSSLVEPGSGIWKDVRERLEGVYDEPSGSHIRELVGQGKQIFGNEYLRKARLGQGAFRLMTIKNFSHRCCVTGETTGPVLQAAHIQPVSADGDHSVRNGLLLRADVHILYDQGLIGIDHAYRIRVSPKIKDLYLNGKVYYAHDLAPMRSIPAVKDLRPDPALLDWHMQTIFQA